MLLPGPAKCSQFVICMYTYILNNVGFFTVFKYLLLCGCMCCHYLLKLASYLNYCRCSLVFKWEAACLRHNRISKIKQQSPFLTVHWTTGRLWERRGTLSVKVGSGGLSILLFSLSSCITMQLSCCKTLENMPCVLSQDRAPTCTGGVSHYIATELLQGSGKDISWGAVPIWWRNLLRSPIDADFRSHVTSESSRNTS